MLRLPGECVAAGAARELAQAVHLSHLQIDLERRVDDLERADEPDLRDLVLDTRARLYDLDWRIVSAGVDLEAFLLREWVSRLSDQEQALNEHGCR